MTNGQACGVQQVGHRCQFCTTFKLLTASPTVLSRMSGTAQEVTSDQACVLLVRCAADQQAEASSESFPGCS